MDPVSDERLSEYEALPPGFVEASPTDLASYLPGPSLIHLPGRRWPPLFVSVLLHGNETTGLEAIQSLLAEYSGRQLPRALSLFVGNVRAAESGARHLDDQADFNRIWPGTPHTDRPETAVASAVWQRMRQRGCFASIDIHNNSGRNPHYACINRLEPSFLALASLFSRTIVYFTWPHGVQSLAFAELCPSVTVECGQPGNPAGAEHARELVDAALRLDHVPTHVVPTDLGVFHTMATAYVAADCEFAFEPDNADLTLVRDLDALNFHELPAGSRFGRVRNHPAPIEVFDEAGRPVADRYFRRDGDGIVTRRPVMPAMLTLDPRIVRQDCLCYLMERLDIQRALKGSAGVPHVD